MKRSLIVLLLLLTAVVAVACAQTPAVNEEVVQPTVEAPTAEAVVEEVATPTAAPVEEPAAPSIAEIAAGNEDFSTLVAALSAAGLVETLSGEGNFTVFAPTNAAFEALPEGTVDALLADPQGDLTKILLYHVVDGKAMAADVVGLESVTTLEGQDVAIAVVDGGVRLNDAANVVTTDIEASNGVIHVIDAVLLPPAEEGAMGEEAAPSIAEIAAGNEDFSTLVAALSAAGLVETLSGEGNFTVFAPTNAAFEALPAGTVDALLADPEGDLTKILLYHVVDGKAMAADVVGLESVTTLEGQDVAIAVVDGGVRLNDAANVVTTDIEASNGVIHVIDAVLLPPAEEGAMGEEAAPSIAEIAAGNEDFSTLVAALSAAGLVETLSGEGPFTVFAPTNAAFEALPAGTLDALLADPQGQLTDILLYHVVPGQVMAADVAMLTSADTVNGLPITIAAGDDGVFLNGGVKVVTTDIQASNGVIHVIDAVLLPPTE
jgi:uncharacterized surface protein with fasciclin (FAS1) repeats